jgi:hypothetical protein
MGEDDEIQNLKERDASQVDKDIENEQVLE